MDIYIVKLHQNNGESYEDNYQWDTYEYYSTWELAYSYFCNQIADSYKGEYTLIKKTLDTQEEIVLETSPWGGYTSMYDQEEYEEYVEPAEDKECYGPEYSIEDAWRYMDLENTCTNWNESEDIDSWLTHKGENYQIFKEIEECETLKLLKLLDNLLEH